MWKGEAYVFKTIHQNFKWSKNDPSHIEDIVALSWKIISDKTTEIKLINDASTDVYPAHYYSLAKETETLQTTSTFTGLSKNKCHCKDEDHKDAQTDMRINKKVKSGQTIQYKLSFKGFT